LLAAACVALISVFAKFASEVTERETGSFDTAVRDWVFAHRSPVAATVFGLITQLGSKYALILGPAIVVLILVRRGARIRPLLVATLPFLFSFIVRALKATYQIERPPTGVTEAISFGFPSGHTSGATAVAIVVGYVLARERVARRLGWAIAVVIPLAVGISRVYLDMHWASDVIGGWIIGVAYAAAVCALYERAHARAAYLARQSP
jgi:membrane-associated phospholipid phosphatase